MRPLLCLAAFACAPALFAQTSFPMITYAYPVAVQRGQTTEVLVDGTQNFLGVYKALFEGSGLKAELLGEAPQNVATSNVPVVKQVKLKITVDADAKLGVREFRLATALGVSSIGQLVVVDAPVIVEKDGNDLLQKAPAIKLPCVVAGKLEVVEDLDHYKFEGKEGEHVTFELHCARLQDKIHDLQKHAKPMLVLLDGEGRELAANDHFYFADPMLSFVLPKAGPYVIQVRESTYDGDPRWVYALSATNKPYASHVLPFAGNPGKTLDVTAIGSAGKSKAKVVVPAKLGVQEVQVDLGGELSNPVTFLVSDLPQTLEIPGSSEEKPQSVTLPTGINGRIALKREMDYYRFAAKKGQSLRLELKARRFGTLYNSSLHGVLEILNAKGVQLAGNDTSHSQEASLTYVVPADGDYTLRVRDLNSKGGPSFVYYVEMEETRPDFSLRVDPDKAMIGPGSSAAWYVHVLRTGGFAGPVAVEVKGLPNEITATSVTISPTMTVGLIVLTAAQDATLSATQVELVGTAVLKSGEAPAVRVVQSNQEIYSPGGGRAKFDVNTQVIAVTNPSDIQKVDVSTTEITLKPGEEVKIDVTILRRLDYDKGVSLDVMLAHLGTVFGNPLPPGVTVVPGKSKTLLGTGSKGYVTLKAAPTSEPVERVPISVVANVSINFVVKVAYSSPPILITIVKK